MRSVVKEKSQWGHHNTVQVSGVHAVQRKEHKMTREQKRGTLQQVSQMTGLPVHVIQNYEQNTGRPTDFLTWVCLASYYGRTMLLTPFIIHHMEWPVAEVYMMYLKNGESVQYSAKQARKLLYKEDYT
jgi:hypothetical protein